MQSKININNHIENARFQLKDMIEQLIGEDNFCETEIPGLAIHRWKHPTEPISYLLDTSICIILQGRKRVVLGEEDYYYQTDQFLVSSLDLPIIANIVEATEDNPYLGITYNLNQKEIANLLINSEFYQNKPQETSASITVGNMSLSLYYSFLRLISLVNEPENIKILAPIIHKEILYRLLMSEQGPRLREIGINGSKESHIAKAIEWLKNNYNTQLKIENLAAHVRMSSSSLHQHFREMTNMSPLQYQKWIRLHEARRLMLSEKLDASNAAFEVGYESPSQFSREYKRMFGNPPLRDIKQMSIQS
jgi:AraC-like DNA-binding protein